MTTTFHLFVIHTQRLTHRQARLHGVIQQLRQTAEGCGYTFKPYMTLKPDPEHLQSDLEKLNARIKYDPVGIEQFDKTSNILTIEQLSNIEKHRNAWRRICELPSTDVFMIIEDDAFIVPGCDEHLKTFIKMDHPVLYDFCSMGLSDTSGAGSGATLLNIRDLGTVLPSKDAYLVNRSTARLFLNATETITFTLRIQLSYIIHSHPTIQAVYPSQRMMLEGSKLGFYTSSLHPNNMLIYNQEYMDLWSYMTRDVVPVKEIRDIYKKIEHIRNPDVMHLVGVLLYKGKDVEEAGSVMSEAINEMIKQHGVITHRSDLLNNYINIHEFLQPELTDASSKPSRYSRFEKQRIASSPEKQCQ